MSGNLFIISAPSGAGKTSLVHALLDINPHIDLSVSYTTRDPRPGELDGKDYHFVSREIFSRWQNAASFWKAPKSMATFTAHRKPGSARKTPRDATSCWRSTGRARRRCGACFPECISIFILPPSMEALEQRLKGRGKDNDAVIAKRMAAVREDVAHVAEFDYVIINDNLNEALRELNAVVLSARLRCAKQLSRHQALINQLQKPE